MREVVEDIIKRIRYKEELLMLVNQIGLVESLIFKGDGKISERGKGILNEKFRYLIQELEEKGILSEDKIHNEIFFEKLKNYLKNVKTIKLKIAFRPRDTFLIRLSEWVKKNMGKEVIIDIDYDDKILGGAIIEFKGKRIDLSLNSKIDELIINKY
jgi:hypothetical protein